ncbi:hypothetical protein Tco_1545770 [Tanacetum coccineum]
MLMRRAEQLFLDVIRMMRAFERKCKKGKLLNLWELRKRLDQSERILQVKIPNPKKMCRYYHKLWNLKKSTIIAEVDATFIPNVGNNGCTTVLDAVGGFVAWPKNQVVLDPKATPPSTIQMITGENKTAPKVQTKRKNVYVFCNTPKIHLQRSGIPNGVLLRNTQQ